MARATRLCPPYWELEPLMSDDNRDSDDQGRYDPRNTLNDLTGKEWIKFTRSWFVADSGRYWRNKETEMHPARFPEEMVAQFIRFFTKSGDWVLDPFAGSGATLVSCLETGRHAVGIELTEKYAVITRSRLDQTALFSGAHVIQGDAGEADNADFWRDHPVAGLDLGQDDLPAFDFIVTSPPYWDVLRHSRGGVESTHKQRSKSGLDTHYSDDPRDLGNVDDYDEFIDALGDVFDGLYDVLKPGGYMTVIVQNVRTPEGEVKPLAWDLGRRIGRKFSFQGERIWCQDSKMLGIWGYPHIFVPNYHHHYCLIFRRLEE